MAAMTAFLVLAAFTLVVQLQPTFAQGRYIYHEFNVHFFEGAPNGVRKQILGVNGQFPGPTIHATIGDILEVKVINNIQTPNGNRENTSIHWHGLEQYGVPFEDGPEYVTQCPILYNHTQTYKFQLVQAGTYWWHSHHAWQYTEGYWGALVIQNRPETHAMDYAHGNELTIALSDWFNPPVADITDWYLSAANTLGSPPIPDSVLINGRGLYPCAAARAEGFECDPSQQGYPIFNVTRGQTYRIRVVNTAAAISTTFSIDNHKLRVIEVDGVDTLKGEPVDVAILAPAQRYSFLVEMDNMDPVADGQFWIRVHAPGVPIRFPNFKPGPSQFDPNAYAVLRYVDPDPNAFGPFDFTPQEVGPSDGAVTVSQGRPATHDRPVMVLERSAMSRTFFPQLLSYSLANDIELVSSTNLPHSRPEPNLVALDEQTCRPIDMRAPNFITQNVTLDVGFAKQRDGSYRWSFNRQIYTMSRNHEPALYQVLNGKRVDRGYNPIYTDVGRGQSKVVQLVINNPMAAPHPFHLHGHTFWVVGKGKALAGYFIPELHAQNFTLDGVRRDTVTVDSFSYIVVRYYADSPGTWLLHCHINWHLHGGLGMVFVEGSRDIRSFTRVPRGWLDVCEKSGLRLS